MNTSPYPIHMHTANGCLKKAQTPFFGVRSHQVVGPVGVRTFGGKGTSSGFFLPQPSCSDTQASIGSKFLGSDK